MFPPFIIEIFPPGGNMTGGICWVTIDDDDDDGDDKDNDKKRQRDRCKQGQKAY